KDQKPPRPGPKPDTTIPLNAVSDKPRKLTKLTNAEWKCLIAQGACFKCRQTGHMASQCPTQITPSTSNPPAPSRRSLAANVVNVGTSTSSENALHQE